MKSAACVRFVFAYFVLYIFPFPVTAIPGLQIVSTTYFSLWNAVVPWVGEHLFHIAITVLPNGSGDTTFNYVQVFCSLMIAATVATVWMMLDRQRARYPRLYDGLRVYVRYYLASTMITYGAVKVIKSQFPNPPLDPLLQPFGDASPMGLLWTFMGVSESYNLFTGAGGGQKGVRRPCTAISSIWHLESRRIRGRWRESAAADYRQGTMEAGDFRSPPNDRHPAYERHAPSLYAQARSRKKDDGTHETRRSNLEYDTLLPAAGTRRDRASGNV